MLACIRRWSENCSNREWVLSCSMFDKDGMFSDNCGENFLTCQRSPLSFDFSQLTFHYRAEEEVVIEWCSFENRRSTSVH
ncbi:hypothetical protein PPTG_21390 [Phytophthora nicotianae INRA-310]|uniref:Uncharacterized protein n=1 Tax=Phytophthora nicotianae (strain INRA-310) TaxID=761204 RepID=W2R2R9_PHYN3|nr:hypothetical protein PPTG_21390 [Phytophthora nicotianae INRA-310]ETN19004.1 hypothetical protein PPTG_21390 [Phytophthora nicotianae INRA-310]